MKGKKIFAVCLIGCWLILCLSGCYGAQKKWVSKMNQEFKEDTFTYTGAEPGELGAHADIANMSSEKYPDQVVRVKKSGGQFTTNYNFIRYREDINSYFDDYFSEYFDCGIIAGYNPSDEQAEYTPIRDYSLSAYMDEKVSCNRVHLKLFYENEVPDEQAMTESLLQIIKDRGEAVDLYIEVYNCALSENPPKGSIVKIYCAYMKAPGRIDYIYTDVSGGGEKVFLVENMEI